MNKVMMKMKKGKGSWRRTETKMEMRIRQQLLFSPSCILSHSTLIPPESQHFSLECFTAATSMRSRFHLFHKSTNKTSSNWLIFLASWFVILALMHHSSFSGSLIALSALHHQSGQFTLKIYPFDLNAPAVFVSICTQSKYLLSSHLV